MIKEVKLVETTSKKIKIISSIETKPGESQRPETPQPKSTKKAQKN